MLDFRIDVGDEDFIDVYWYIKGIFYLFFKSYIFVFFSK